MNWLLPPSMSTFGPDIDRLYYIILAITGLIFLLTEITLVLFLVKYRHREGRKAEYIHGNVSAEVVWTVIPFVIVVGLALYSRGIWDQIRNPDRIPADAMEVRLTARQFEWNATYPGPDGELDTGDDFSVLNQLHVPVDRPVRIRLESEDVIHSFFVPDFRVKQDAVPGMETPVWFEATEAGDYPIGCAELCGLGHYRMRGTVTVHAAPDFEAWLSQQTTPADS